MKLNSLQDLYLEQLKDLYDAEHQLIKALPKMAKASSSAELREAFEQHLEKTKEGSEVIEEDMEDGVKDAALIAAAQRVEHYEMAGYGCVRTYASLLGETKAAGLLEKTLQEEEEADRTLGGIAEQINVAIPQGRIQNAKRTVNMAGRRSKSAA